jgi:predicted MFS family arabinose efflux permease
MNITVGSTLTSDNGGTQWRAVWAYAVAVFGMILSEFIATGALSQISEDIGITRGLAGQTITATAFFAVLTSLLLANLTRNLNRRTVLLWLSLFLTVSNLIVAVSPSFQFLLLGRILLGLSVGGIWSMAAATVMRLVSPAQLPQALAIVFGGSSLALIIAAPIGSLLGHFVGWRYVFVCASGIGAIAFHLQLFSLPKLPPVAGLNFRATMSVLRAPRFAVGLIAVMFAFCGRFASITYLRPLLEGTTHLNVEWISAVMLIFGVAYFVGDMLSPMVVKRGLKAAIALPLFILVAVTVGLSFPGSNAYPTIALIVLLGALFSPLPPAFTTWIATTLPERAEVGGGLYIASVQLAAAIGALVGGFAFNLFGAKGVFLMCGLSWLLSALLVYLKVSNPRSVE